MKIRVLKKKQKISFRDLRVLGKEYYEDILVGAVDLESGAIAFGGEFSHDCRDALIDDGIPMENIWGFKMLFDEKPSHKDIEFSLADVRPCEGNIELGKGAGEGKNEIIRELIEVRISK